MLERSNAWMFNRFDIGTFNRLELETMPHFSRDCLATLQGGRLVGAYGFSGGYFVVGGS
jgi:hypothetical protein